MLAGAQARRRPFPGNLLARQTMWWSFPKPAPAGARVPAQDGTSLCHPLDVCAQRGSRGLRAGRRPEEPSKWPARRTESGRGGRHTLSREPRAPRQPRRPSAVDGVPCILPHRGHTWTVEHSIPLWHTYAMIAHRRGESVVAAQRTPGQRPVGVTASPRPGPCCDDGRRRARCHVHHWFGFHGKQQVGMRPMQGDDYVV